MQDTESNKNERRQILSTLQDWNIGITPNGKLATEPCFVHNAVPNIVYEQNSKTESTFICTESEWTANLLSSNTSNPCDTETVKSLSVCSSIFHVKPVLNTRALHLVQYDVKAYITVNDIARLTKEFVDELSKAEEHWPHSPQKSWDKLCLIWNKYGFLWPQRVQIGKRLQNVFYNVPTLCYATGYKSHKKIETVEDMDKQNIKINVCKLNNNCLVYLMILSFDVVARKNITRYITEPEKLFSHLENKPQTNARIFPS